MTIAVRGKGGLWGVAILLAFLPACGSGSSKCGSNCGKDAATDARRDALFDEAQEMSVMDRHDAQADSRSSLDLANACDQSITAACAATHDAGAFSIHCAASWDVAVTNAYFCSRPQTTVLVETCGNSRELIDTNGSDEYIYVYDSSGALAAISYSTGGGSHCVAGPETFVDPVTCDLPVVFSCSADAGHHG